jgi:hypothetical protein
MGPQEGFEARDPLVALRDEALEGERPSLVMAERRDLADHRREPPVGGPPDGRQPALVRGAVRLAGALEAGETALEGATGGVAGRRPSRGRLPTGRTRRLPLRRPPHHVQ